MPRRVSAKRREYLKRREESFSTDFKHTELPRYNACGALGASYRGMADMEPAPPAVVAPPVLTIPMLERENARAA